MADENEDGLDEASDAKASVGDIFGVSSGKKKKKKKKPEPEPEPVEEPSVQSAPDASGELAGDDSIPFPDGDDDGAADESDEITNVAAKPKKKKKSTAAVDGVLRPSAEPAPDMSDDYLGDSDLGDYDAPKSKTVPVLVGVIVVLLLVITAGGIVMGGLGGDLVALFKGELREKRLAEARMAKEKHEAEQQAKLEKFGNLMIMGNPQYALVKLNGQVQYGKTSQGWREVRIGTSPGVQDLKIKQTHQVEFSAPGFETVNIEVTEGKWQEVIGAGWQYAVQPTLLPTSVEAKTEFDARMSEDIENEFFGKVTINSMPSGATVVLNNKPLLNEKGEELVTPVSFDKYWEKNEESGKLEEKQVKVDTALDIGHKIQVFFPSESKCPEGQTPPPACGTVDNCCPEECSVATDTDCKWPGYITSLTRPMWTCTWNTEDGQAPPPDKIAKDKTIQHYCDYTFQLDVDFNGLKTYIVQREEERKRIMEQYKALGGADAGEAPEGEETAAAAQ